MLNPALAMPVNPRRSFWSRRSAADLIFAVVVLFATIWAWVKYHTFMDVYEQGILLGAALTVTTLGWHWRAMRLYFPICALVALFATGLYQGDLARGGTSFWLKYLLSSQSGVMWMCVLFFLATGMYWLGLWRRSDTAESIASGLTWAAAGAAFIALLVRWFESYLIGPDVGHIPVSNLYEVFVLFCLITALMYLYFEGRFATKRLGAFVLIVISASVGFILWYTFDRQAHEIQPLIPALQSWWMKIHVPANFVGYGAFSLAAMLGVGWLLATPKEISPKARRGFLIAAGVVFVLTLGWQFIWSSHFPDLSSGIGLISGFGFSGCGMLVIAAFPGALVGRLPEPKLIDEMAYRVVAFGFLFFTIATILGATWAADAWGSYWSWDPKEVWALVVWLNYAAWLHIRLIKGWRGEVLAWWSVVGLLITTFAFLGVNMFLSGLHSYGKI